MITSTLCFYPTSDMNATLHFYRDIIGLTVSMESPQQCVFSSPKGNLGFVDYGDDVKAQGHICISMNCGSREEVDAEYERVTAMGVVAKTSPLKHPKFPVYSFFLEDPNGYTVEFQKIDGISL